MDEKNGDEVKMNLILFGFKGAGKTYFGRKLAQMMRRPFIDTDDLIIAFFADKKKERLSLKQIYQKLGKEGFRNLETEAIFSLEKMEDTIIALGGGAVVNPDNVTFLQKLGALVYLKTSPETLKNRMYQAAKQGETPAVFDEKELEKSFWNLIQERLPIYESIRCDVVDTDKLDEAGVLAELRALLVLADPPNGF